MNKTRICFIGNLSSSFIRSDYEILKKHFDVEVVQPPKTKSGWLKYPPLIAKKMWHCNLSFSWFAGWLSLFPVIISKLFRKKSIVVVGGYDAAYAPEINYGAFTNLKERVPAKYALKHADLLLPVSEFTKKEILEKIKPKKLKVVYNGVDTDKFKPVQEKENMVVTIGSVTEQGIKLKGLETFAKASVNFSDYDFIIIGRMEESAVNKLKKANPNLIFTDQISHGDVLKWLQRAKIYCQLSYRESFGMGIAEAMSCGCTPIITKRGAIPEVVGDAGFYVPYRDEKATAEAIKKALNTPDELGKKARERIKEKFTIKKREKELVKIMR